MAKVESWFPTLIYSHKLDVFEDNNYLKEKSLLLRDDYKSNSSTTWKCDTFNTLGQYYDYNNDEICSTW